MSNLLITATILITCALAFYSLGVWAERIARYLKAWHVVAFWCGFAFDVAGTYTMHLISNGMFDLSNPHTLTGQIAIWVMFIHAIWATWVILKGSEKAHRNFHTYSLIVWLIWLVPYFGGMFLGVK
jgi:uncharacterized repeat protein (TIGR03987 family)